MNLKIPSFENYLKEKNLLLGEITPLSGGSIASSYKIKLSGKDYFFKTYGLSSDCHQLETHGLKLLQESNGPAVPEIIHANDDFILLEFIEEGQKNAEFYTRYGTELAKFHKTEYQQIGLDRNNYIGKTPQSNTLIEVKEGQLKEQWLDFFWEYRIMAQFKMTSYPEEVKNCFNELESKLPGMFNDWNGHMSLLHGDLWGQNHLSSKNGKAYLIDPAIYFGCREADLALINLFNAYPDEFWFAYKEEFPLPPGYQKRKKLYALYHLMNHFLLFGGGYLDQIRNNLYSLLARPGYL